MVKSKITIGNEINGDVITRDMTDEEQHYYDNLFAELNKNQNDPSK